MWHGHRPIPAEEATTYSLLRAFHYPRQKTFDCQEKWPTLMALSRDGRKLELEHRVKNLSQMQGRDFQRGM